MRWTQCLWWGIGTLHAEVNEYDLIVLDWWFRRSMIGCAQEESGIEQCPMADSACEDIVRCLDAGLMISDETIRFWNLSSNPPSFCAGKDRQRTPSWEIDVLTYCSGDHKAYAKWERDLDLTAKNTPFRVFMRNPDKILTRTMISIMSGITIWLDEQLSCYVLSSEKW